MDSAAERLSVLKEKIELARAANTKAVEVELREAAEQEGAGERQRKRRIQARLEAKAAVKNAKRSGALFLDRNGVLTESAEDADKRVECGRKRSSTNNISGGRFDDENVIKAYEKRLKAVPKGRKNGYAGSEMAEDLNRLVEELGNTKKRRKTFNRRRAFNEDEGDIAFINERNRKFNAKLSRTFDDYTAVIRDNLERGTALPDE